MNYLILLTTLFFVLGCQDQKVQQQWFLALKSKLPQGWKIEVTDYNQAPFQWEGKNFVGKRLKLWKDSSKETVDLPYSKDNKTYQSEKKIVRYLYEKMQGGYRYKMMERVHPDKVEVITNQFIIITPSNFSFDRDINPGKEIYDIYR